MHKIDPHRTMAAGKVEIGAFRTLPKPANGTSAAPSNRGGDGGGDSFQAIPMDKIEDFGVHANQYYSLSISYFKSSLDEALLGKLWNRYWVNTLSSSTILTVSP
jgi:COP9 signalosome complex subunit 5